MSLPVLLFLSATLTGIGPIAADAGKKELEKLQGVWRLEARQEEGRDDNAKELGKMSIAMVGNQIKIDEDGKLSEGTFGIDAGKKPAEIDLTPSKGDAGKVLGIYQVAGDTLKLCYARPGSA